MEHALFTTPQRIEAVDMTSCYGVVLLTKTLAIKCVKLGFVLVQAAAATPLPLLPPSPSDQQVAADLVFCEYTLRPPAATEPSTAAPPAAPIRVSRTLLDRMPTQEEASGALDGY
jgi:hypothetical protein